VSHNPWQSTYRQPFFDRMYFVRIAFWFAILVPSTVKYRITAPYYGNGPESYPRIVNGINPLEWVKNLAEREGFEPSVQVLARTTV
jgi:hypothetical protein